MSEDSSFLPQRILITRNALHVGDNVIGDNVLVLSCSFAPLKAKARFHAHAMVTTQGAHIEISDDLLALGASFHSTQVLGGCLKLPKLRMNVFFPLLEWFDVSRLATLPLDAEAGHSLVIPFQGCLRQKYFEGPICHLDEGGTVRSYIPPALGFGLELPIHLSENVGGAGQSLADHLSEPDVKSHNIRRSLAAAILAHMPSVAGQSCRVKIPSFQLEYAILLVGLRVALGERIICTSLDEKGQDALLPAWRRLCQHLNIFFGKSVVGVDVTDSIDLSQFLHLIPPNQACDIANALNHFGLVLPKRLISSEAYYVAPK